MVQDYAMLCAFVSNGSISALCSVLCIVVAWHACWGASWSCFLMDCFWDHGLTLHQKAIGEDFLCSRKGWDGIQTPFVLCYIPASTDFQRALIAFVRKWMLVSLKNKVLILCSCLLCWYFFPQRIESSFLTQIDQCCYHFYFVVKYFFIAHGVLVFVFFYLLFSSFV